jgi:glycine/D-amino acid oxidase-like deaminating enzyme
MTAKRHQACVVAVIGAGPYGLSVAAHLKHAGISTRVFGDPMSFWREHMPKGMLLRSPWRATSLSDVDGALSLDAYAAERGIDAENRLPREELVAYGEWFQQRVAPDIERRMVSRVESANDCFQLTLADGEIFAADRVVVATGLANQEYRPPAFRDLPGAFVSHTCQHADFAPFCGKRVAVIGRGQSSCESAALLAGAGAEVEIIGRGDIRWLGTDTMARKSAIWRLRDALAAPSAIGPLPWSWLVEFPDLVRHLPENLRDGFTKRCLKAGGAGWLKPRFANVKYTTADVAGARAVPGGIALDLDIGTRSFDHVLLGTGYRVDLSRLGFLSPRLLARVARVDGHPRLGAGLESSVAKLHFVGCYAVKSFGPLMQFISGTAFAARSVAKAARADAASSEIIGRSRPGRRPLDPALPEVPATQ